MKSTYKKAIKNSGKIIGYYGKLDDKYTYSYIMFDTKHSTLSILDTQIENSSTSVAHLNNIYITSESELQCIVEKCIHIHNTYDINLLCNNYDEYKKCCEYM